MYRFVGILGRPKFSKNSATFPAKCAQQRLKSDSSSDRSNLGKRYQPKERRFPTPYGQLAALEWGNPDAENKILCAHGWLDNAASFEPLVPYLLDHGDNFNRHHIISMDQPGLGFSSHKPPGAEYNISSVMIEMRRIIDHLNWDRVTLLTHSFGSHIGFIFTCIYQEQIRNLITLDVPYPFTHPANNWHLRVAKSIEEHFKCENYLENDPAVNIRVPVYGEVDAVKRLMAGGSLTRESAEILLKRGAKRQTLGYTFTRDMRLRYLPIEMRLDDELMLKHLDGPFRANLIVVRASLSSPAGPDSVRKRYYDLFERNCPLFRDVVLPGTHHIHMNSPEIVAPEIIKFLHDVETGSASDKSQL